MRSKLVEVMTAQYAASNMDGGNSERTERNAKKVVEGLRDDEIGPFLVNATGTDNFQTATEMMKRMVYERMDAFCLAARDMKAHPGFWASQLKRGAAGQNRVEARQKTRRVLLVCISGEQEAKYIDPITTPIKVASIFDASDIKFTLQQAGPVLEFKLELKKLNTIDPAKEFVLKLCCAKTKQHLMAVLNWDGGFAKNPGRA